jgi:tRNA(fMet)-specific endonuclease VapC
MDTIHYMATTFRVEPATIAPPGQTPAEVRFSGQGRVAERLLGCRPSQLCISSITLAGLRFGAQARRSRKLYGLITTFVESVEAVVFDQRAADHFGTVAKALARRVVPIGTFDTLMAAHALSLGLTLVTNNAQHFARVAGLKTENWV